MFNLDIKSKVINEEILTDDVNLNEAFKKEKNTTREDIFSILEDTSNQDIDKLLDLKTKERNIRNDLYILQSKSED